jgi:hypothetical protein
VKAKTRQNKKQPLHKHMHRHVGLVCVPQPANEYRPHLIRRYGLLMVLLFVVGIQLLYNVGTTGSVLGEKANISMTALLDETNEARRDHHLSDLRLDQKLNEAAQLKVDDMFARQYWAHDAPDGTKPWKWLTDVGYGYSEAGENLAMNFYTAEATMTAWLNSSEHRENILEPKYTGVGFAVSSGTLKGKPATIVVALYAHPAGLTPSLTGMSVAGVHSQPLDPLTRLGIGIQSMTPAALGSVLLLGFVAMVAFVAHLYRHHLPRALQQSRYRHHHGVIKMGGMFSIMLIMLYLYSGGQV